MSDVDQQSRRKIRRTTVILVAVAIAFYLGFILSGIVKS